MARIVETATGTIEKTEVAKILDEHFDALGKNVTVEVQRVGERELVAADLRAGDEKSDSSLAAASSRRWRPQHPKCSRLEDSFIDMAKVRVELGLEESTPCSEPE